MKLSSKKAWLSLLLVPPIWLFVKLRLFHGLEYSSDLYTYLQLSRTFFEGKGLLYEHVTGGMLGAHNLFAPLLFYPLTAFIGVTAFFLVHAVCLGAAFVYVGSWLVERAGNQRAVWVFAALFFGPTAFWLWDVPFYGWYPELLYLPLGLLFLVGMLRGSRLLFLWAGLILLIREDGPVVVLGALLAFLAHQMIIRRAEEGREPEWRPIFVRAGVAVLACFTVFLAGMGMMQLGDAPARLPAVFANVMEIAATHGAAYMNSYVLVRWLLLLSPALVVCALDRRRKYLLPFVLLAIVPPFVTGTVAGLYYKETYWQFGPLWEPRFVMGWACAVFFAVVSLPYVSRAFEGKRGLFKLAGACCVLLAAQAVLLAPPKATVPALAFRYSPFRRVLKALRGTVIAAQLDVTERDTLQCLGEQLARRTHVTAEPRLFIYFQRQDYMWSNYLRSNEPEPEFYVCDTGKRLDSGCESIFGAIDPRPFQHFNVGQMMIGAAQPEGAEAAKKCGASLNEATLTVR